MGDIKSAREGAHQKIGQSIDSEDARELVYGGDTDDYTFVHDEYLGDSRWDSNHLIVFRDQESEELLGFYFSTGLTENQDYDSLDDEEFVEVFPVTYTTKTIRVYSKKED